MSWHKYLQATSNIKCRPLLKEALSFVKGSQALDLGAGALGDTSCLLELGFTVTAVDSNPKIIEYAKDNPALSVVIATYEDFEYPHDFYDLVNAQYALPFNKPETFDSVFKRIVDSLKVGGIFTGQFFGVEDGWAGKEGMTFCTEEKVHELMSLFTNVHILREEKKVGPTAIGGEKLWHVFHIIAEK